jgi:hypothetical protein
VDHDGGDLIVFSMGCLISHDPCADSDLNGFMGIAFHAIFEYRLSRTDPRPALRAGWG